MLHSSRENQENPSLNNVLICCVLPLFIISDLSVPERLALFSFNPIQYGGHYGPYSFPSISPERLELRPSNFLTFNFYLLAVRKI